MSVWCGYLATPVDWLWREEEGERAADVTLLRASRLLAAQPVRTSSSNSSRRHTAIHKHMSYIIYIECELLSKCWLAAVIVNGSH